MQTILTLGEEDRIWSTISGRGVASTPRPIEKTTALGEKKVIRSAANGALITANWRRVPFLLWSVLFISFCLSGYYGILWIDWNAAISPQEALQQSPSLAAQIDPKWKAVLINHGEVSEWPRGTSQQNPEAFQSVTHLFDLYWIINLGLLFAVLALASQKKRPEG